MLFPTSQMCATSLTLQPRRNTLFPHRFAPPHITPPHLAIR